MAVFVSDESECFADVLRKPRLAARASGDEGFVHPADHKVVSGFVEKFQPALDIDYAVGWWLGGWGGEFG